MRFKGNIYLGKFIVFEGPDGSGQTTQADILKRFLEAKGQSVILTKEPTLDSEAGRRIREILDGEVKAEPAEMQKLFVQDREEDVKNAIIPALKSGKTVISDRYILSTLAFGMADGLDLKWLIGLNKDFIFPDATFILDVPAEVCIERIVKRGKGFKYFEKLEKLSRVLENYKRLAEKFSAEGKEIYLINGKLPIRKVAERIKKRLPPGLMSAYK